MQVPHGLHAISLLTSCVVLFYITKRRAKRYWLREVPGPLCSPGWKGHLTQLLDPHSWDFHANLLAHYGRIVRLYGVFSDPMLYVSDPVAMRSIIITNQDVYNETSLFLERNMIVFGPGLLSTYGHNHRRQRKIISPVFSDQNLGNLIDTFQKISYECKDSMIEASFNSPTGEVDVYLHMRRLAMEASGQAVAGFSFNSFEGEDELGYGSAMRNLVPALYALHIPMLFLPILKRLVPVCLGKVFVAIIPSKAVRRIRHIVNLMHEWAESIYNSRLDVLYEDSTVNGTQFRDIFTTLMKANNMANAEDTLPKDEIVAQMSTFVFAGSDTMTSLLSRIFHLLAEHQEIQDELRAELRRVSESDVLKLDVATLRSLPLLDAVCRETLRLYPPIPFQNRTCLKDVLLPCGTFSSTVDGRTISEVHVPKGTNIVVSILNINRDEELWGSDAAQWKPDRWSRPLPAELLQSNVPGVYSNVMTFLGGGRSCIGFRFAILELKTALYVLLPSLRFSLSDKEIHWRLPGVSVPSIEGAGNFDHSLPLQIRVLSKD